MYRSVPYVEWGVLYQSESNSDVILVGTPAWYDWLEHHAAFVFTDLTASFLVQKSSAISPEWIATRIHANKLYRVSLGSSQALTLSQLQTAARGLEVQLAGSQSAPLSPTEPAVPAGPTAAGTLDSLIQSKLYRPPGSSNVIPRPQLFDRLNAALSGKVILLCAPIGSGKTTLLADWVQTSGSTAAWLSLDEGDNELAIFVRSLAAALQSVFPNALQATAGLLTAPQFPSADRVTTLLINELADVPEEIVLILDDYHLIHNSEVHHLIETLVEHLPARLRLALATRSDPPLPLVKWLAQGYLHELRQADLRFRLAETEAFLTLVLDDEMAHEAADVLQEQTEGWIATIRLAALAFRSTADRSAFLEQLADSSLPRSLSRYLSEEILNQQSSAVQELLEQIAILDRFSVDTCAVILGDNASYEWVQATLQWLERSNLFLIPLDEHEGWYRLHRLFQQFLRQRLQRHSSEAEIATLHLRASAWYAGQGLIEEAIQHALAAGDGSAAARLVEMDFFSALSQEQWGLVERWLHLLPQEHIQSSPILLFARAWIEQAHGQVTEIPRLLAAAEQLLATSSEDAGEPGNQQARFLRTLIADLWSWYQYFTGQAQASLESARSAMAWLPPAEGYLSSLSRQFLALSNQAVGREDVALDILHKAIREQSARPNDTARLLLAQTLVYLAEGKLHQAEYSARHLLRLAQRAELALSQYWAHWALGTVAYERNKLETATYHFSALIANQHQAHFWTVRDAMCGLVLTYWARGLRQEAQATATALLEWVQDRHNMGDLMIAYAFQGQLALLEGEVEQAARWLELAGEQEVLGPMLFLEEPVVTKVRLLLARGDAQDVADGQGMLVRLLQHVDAMHTTRKKIKLLAFQAWAYDRQGREAEAVETLERALVLAYPGGFMRTFADLPQLSRVLAELRKSRRVHRAGDGQLDEYLQNIQVAMMPTPAHAVSRKELLRQEGLEPLTGRELEILHLLQKDLTSREIARELVVTPGTVKLHTQHVYRKLGVNSRRAAVTLARSLGLLAVT